MRRCVLLITVSAFALAGCSDSGLIEPSAAHSGAFAEVRNDSTPSPDAPPASVEGGIMIGSGT